MMYSEVGEDYKNEHTSCVSQDTRCKGRVLTEEKTRCEISPKSHRQEM